MGRRVRAVSPGVFHVSHVARSPSARSSCCSLRRRSCRAAATRTVPCAQRRGEGDPLATGGHRRPGRVTPAMRAEIERVVDTGRTVGRLATKIDPDQHGAPAGPLRRLRGPALLPAHRLDRPAPRPRSRPGWHAPPARSPSGRAAPPRTPATWTRSRSLERAAALEPAGARAGRAPRADRGRPVGGEGLAAAPPDPGRRPARRLPRRATRRPGHRVERPATPRDPVKAHADYPDRAAVLHAPARCLGADAAATGAARRPCR